MSKMYGGSQSARHLHDAEINKVLSQPAAAVQDVKTVQTTRLGKKKKRRRKTSWSESATRLGNARNKKALRKNDCFSETRSFGTESVEHDSVNPAVSSRIRGLEADLTSTLKSMKKIRHALARDPEPDQKRKAALSELEEVSDALEFCETEIMNKKRELRTARAQVTASEGKLAVELMEFSRSIDEKERRLEQALNVLKLLRTVRIVWPNPATEVFLAGSFDGWTSWRRMDKSSAGVFVTALQLYPGQYEIKFIVDGDWRVDLNRPITRASGFENNVITVV